jgi:hypothetical protein
VSYLVVFGSITAVYVAVAAGPEITFLIRTLTLASISHRVGVLTAPDVGNVLGLSLTLDYFRQPGES